MRTKPFQIRECPSCGTPWPASGYPVTRSPFCPDGHLPICKQCLDEMVIDMGGDWGFMDMLCAWADVPWIPEQFTKIWNSSPNNAASQYLKLFNAAEYDRIHWDTYQDRWKKIIQENRDEEIHPLFNQEEINRLRRTWGMSYNEQELYQLDTLYQGISKSYGISDPVSEDNAKKLAKLSIEIDRCIAAGSQGIDKLVTSYNKIQAGAGFTSEHAKDFNNFSSISELALYLEKLGWKKKFHNDETNDIVDQTIHNIQNYNRRLYQQESTISDQIDARIESKKRLDRLEDQILKSNEDYDEVEAMSVEKIEEDEEEFRPEV